MTGCHEIDPLIKGQMQGVRQQLAIKYGLRTEEKKKPIMHAEDEFELLKTVYLSSEMTFNHERHRMQLALVMQLAGITGNRSAALLAVCYRYVKVTLLPDRERPRVLVEILYKYTKGYLGEKERNEFGIPDVPNEPCLLLCPHIAMLALIFADHAFAAPELTSTEQLFHLPVFTSLYHGDYKSVDEAEVNGMPIIDSFLVDRIVSFNIFGCPRTSLEIHFTKLTSESHHHTCGIFIKASHINHSCYGDSRRSFVGGMQIVRATRNIPAGSKILFWYAISGPTYTYEKIQEKLQNWGFQCTCAICQQSKKTKKNFSSKRLALLEDFKAAFGSQTGADLPKVERGLDAIEKTYSEPASDVPRLALWHPYLLLTRIYSSKNRQDKVIETAWKVLMSLGFTIKRQNPLSLKSPFEFEQWGLMEGCLIGMWVHLWTAYAQVAPDPCKKAGEYAKIMYKICIGEDDTFDEKYGKLAHQAMFRGYRLG